MKFISPTYGTCENVDDVIEKVFNRVLSNENADWTLAIGTDSQNKSNITKFCSAILLIEKGKGGVYFYSTHEENLYHVVQNRMLREAELSINLGKELIDRIQEKMLSEEIYNRNINLSFEIHCDLGSQGKSRDSISAAIGWISAEFGNEVTTKIKPYSTAASSIADKYTK